MQVPDGWQVVRLADVLKLEYGVSLPERERLHGPVPVLGSAGLVGFHSQATNEGPGIVIGRKGSIGTVTWVSDDFVPIDTTYFAVPIDGQANLLWLYHLLAHEKLSKLNRATGVPGLNRDDVYALKRWIPPLTEQRAIAAVLDSIDEAIEDTEAVIAATERLRDALLHDLLTRGVPGWHTQWKDVPGIGTIPAAWDVVRLGDVAVVKGGKRLPKGTSFADGDTGLPYIRVVDFQNRTVKTSDIKFLLPEVHKSISRYTISSSDVYISIAGTIGLVGTIPTHFDGANLTENAAKIAIDSQGKLSHHFLSSYLGSFWCQSQIKERINALGQPKLALERIRTIQVPLPPFSEQQTIAGLLDGVDGAVEPMREERNGLLSLKASASDALLTGRVRVG